jgi:diguanylate cyclase (GGDEF)-like protein
MGPLIRAAGKIEDQPRTMATAERDIVALGIAVAALILFIGTGGTVVPQAVQLWLGNGSGPDNVASSALLLNIALIIFGWRRYADLQREVAERRRAELRAQELAAVDPLTGCLNRRSGAPAIEVLLDQCAERGRDLAVLMVDLDNFKQINDLNGHRTGDAVLTETARRIAAVIPGDAVLARIGGDEFLCALCYDPPRRGQVDRLAERIIEAVSRPVDTGMAQVEATVSLGIASHAQLLAGEANGSAPADASEQLIHHADIAMYHAKKQGRNRSAWFEPRMEHEMRQRGEIEAGIRRGLAAAQFVPYYEQQIDLGTGELVGFEMLARWNSPEFGLVSPDVFIPIAEDIDVIGELSEMLIAAALRDAAEWDARLTLSVNISPVQLRDPWFAHKLLRLLGEHQFPAQRLEIEITESCLHENLDLVRSIVNTLKNHGVRISLDDFGTGYSSLSQLRDLPFDRLKIDRSFVTQLTQENMSDDLVSAIISLGRGLALPVTAEGVESTEILQRLRGMGELKGQGYLYGRPENAAATRERLLALDLLAAPDAQPGAAVLPVARQAS